MLKESATGKKTTEVDNVLYIDGLLVNTYLRVCIYGPAATSYVL